MGGDRSDLLLGELFRGLAVAWRALSAYPDGHPAVEEGLRKAHAALASLLAEVGAVDLGAARDALLWEGRAFRAPPAVQLARLLRQRGAATLHVDPGATVAELETFLKAISVDARVASGAGSLAAQLADAGLQRLRVRDVDLSTLTLVEGEEDISAPDAGAFASRVVRRLVSSGALPAAAPPGARAGAGAAPDLLAALFGAGDAGTAGPTDSLEARAALRAVAEDFAECPDAVRASEIASFHQRLPAGDRVRLVEELAAAAARRSLGPAPLAMLAAGLPPRAVADLRTALTRSVAPGPGHARPLREAPVLGAGRLAALRLAFATDDVDAFRGPDGSIDDLADLLELPGGRADLDPSPEAARIGRELASGPAGGDGVGAMLDLAERAELPAEALPAVLRRLEAGFRALLADGRVREAAILAGRVCGRASGEGPAAASFAASAERLAAMEPMRILASSLAGLREEALGAVPALVGYLGPPAVARLLDVLAEEQERRVRLRLLELLARLGPAVARDAEGRLSDPRWYVVRNMLQLLRRVGDAGCVPAVRRCVDHPDLRVRLEAIHDLFAFDRGAARELLARAIDAPDPRQAEAAIDLVGQYRIAEAVEILVSFVQARDALGRRRAARLKAIRALGLLGDPAALDALEEFRGRFQFPPRALEERQEIYRSLPGYPEGAREPWIESGLRARDPEIRRLSGLLASHRGVDP